MLEDEKKIFFLKIVDEVIGNRLVDINTNQLSDPGRGRIRFPGAESTRSGQNSH